MLLGLGGEKVAVSVNVANFASGLSDKLENGDIASEMPLVNCFLQRRRIIRRGLLLGIWEAARLFSPRPIKNRKPKTMEMRYNPPPQRLRSPHLSLMHIWVSVRRQAKMTTIFRFNTDS